MNILAKRRALLGKSQEQVAAALKMSQSQYSRYEKNLGSMSFEKVMELERVLDVDLDYLAFCAEMSRKEKRRAQIRRG